MFRIRWIIVFLGISFSSYGQDTVRIAVINDRVIQNSAIGTELQSRLELEVEQLLQHRYNITFQYYDLIHSEEVQSDQFDLAYANNDIIICTGTVSSDIASRRTTFPKPTIAAFILDSELQGLYKSDG